jgi:hypothetical protein
MVDVIKRKRRSSIPGGFYRFESLRTPRSTISGSGYGDFIRLRDQFGNIWRGQAELMPDDSVMYRFRDADGRTISGVSDSYGIVLRDDKGNIWRGFVD